MRGWYVRRLGEPGRTRTNNVEGEFPVVLRVVALQRLHREAAREPGAQRTRAHVIGPWALNLSGMDVWIVTGKNLSPALLVR